MITMNKGFFFDNEGNMYRVKGISAITNTTGAVKPSGDLFWLIYLFYSSGVSIGINYTDEKLFDVDFKFIKEMVLKYNPPEITAGEYFEQIDKTQIVTNDICGYCGVYGHGIVDCVKLKNTEKLKDTEKPRNVDIDILAAWLLDTKQSLDEGLKARNIHPKNFSQVMGTRLRTKVRSCIRCDLWVPPSDMQGDSCNNCVERVHKSPEQIATLKKIELEKGISDKITAAAQKYFGDRTFTDSKTKVVDVLSVMVTKVFDEFCYRVMIQRHNEMFGGSDFGPAEPPSDKFNDYLEMIFIGANSHRAGKQS